MTLTQDLIGWDGKSAAAVAAIYERYHNCDYFLDRIISVLADSACQKGASWLLKQWLFSDQAISENQINQVYGTLQQLQCWESRLHVLQSIPYMPIAANCRGNVELFLRHCLTDSNKFVRAWAYSGLYELSVQYPKYKDEVQQIFAMALRDEPASIKARIRNVLKAH